MKLPPKPKGPVLVRRVLLANLIGVGAGGLGCQKETKKPVPGAADEDTPPQAPVIPVDDREWDVDPQVNPPNDEPHYIPPQVAPDPDEFEKDVVEAKERIDPPQVTGTGLPPE